ncbi:cytochrome P450 oxidoreductase GliF [Colletotrichum higginsianum]|uniref:Cytochrome P450 oxidoreductase GliF n=1 Tax=Colletotrichum higginsianum (strain IMI 349063) TaxID=759273 RepID=H1UXY8_COLHI|nr:cytochrome P450 oxidoreductase GliF [Colletotrichum higginsianum]
MLSTIQSNIIEPYMVLRQTLGPLKLSRWQLTKIMAKAMLFGSVLRSIFVASVIAFAIYLLWYSVFGEKHTEKILDLPVFKTNASHCDDIIKEGQKKYPNDPFVVVNKRFSFVVYPATVWDELKRIPEHTASVAGYMHHCNSGDWSLVGNETQELWKTMNVDLTRALPAHLGNLQEDIALAFDTVVGRSTKPHEKWHMFTTVGLMGRLNATSFAGRDLGFKAAWYWSVTLAPVFAHFANTLLKMLPDFLKPLARPIFYAPVLLDHQFMRQMLYPIIDKNTKEFREAKDPKEPMAPKPGKNLPFTAFLLARYKDGAATPHQLSTDIIQASYTSIPSTSTSLYHALWNLAQRPEAQEILRKEVEEVMVDGKLPSTHLQELKRMDSFLRESLRLHPITHFALQRRVNKPLKLSIGPELPVGTLIVLDAQAINRSPELYDNPNEFDMDRFWRLRQIPGNDGKYHAVTANATAPIWGDGAQACPGRYYGVCVLKISLAHVLMNYDIELKGGPRPLKPIPVPNGTFGPDPSVKMIWKYKGKNPSPA